MFARLFAIIALFPVLAFSQTEIPFNGSKNTIEYKQAGNSFTWTPVTGETPRSAQPYRPDLSGGAASTVEPKVKWTPQLPYEHKGGTSAKATIHWPVDPNKVSAAASKAAGAAAAGAATGNGYVALSMVACAFVCEPLIAALVDWGVDRLKINDGGGSFSVESIAEDVQTVGNVLYYTDVRRDAFYNTPEEACKASTYILNRTFARLDNGRCRGTDSYTFAIYYNTSTLPLGCSVGYYLRDGVCYAPNNIPKQDVPLTTYLQSNYQGSGWSNHWAGITAGLVAAGVNVFTDGTGSTITGPAVVPVSTSQTQTPVNLSPGTTTPAPTGTTGATDPGTQTTTTTTTANNTYRPGSAGSGPSMETKTQTQTTTNITNNVTNTTSSTVINNTTETDKAPEEEQKDFCEKNPDSLACSELDTPEGEVPRDTIEIDFEPEDLGLGAGTCPPDKPIDDLTVFSYQPTCDVLDTYVYPMTIAFAMFGALLIIFVGKAEA